MSIAVIIPLYNGARHIEAAVLSVFRQTLPAAEVIVVDDGSTDGGAGAAIVSRLARAYPIKLVFKANGGQSSARNWGLTHTGCDLIAFLDHDDIWYEHHLAELVKPFRRTSYPPLGWVYSDVDEVDEDGRTVCRFYLRTMPTAHPKQTIFDCIGQDMYILPSATLIARAAFEHVGGFDEALCGYEDDDLFLRLFQAGYDHAFLDQSLSKWRISTRSASYSPRMTESRRLYAAKLMAKFPDDARRARYYIRDLIAPRFFGRAMYDYEEAVKTVHRHESERAWREVRGLARYNEGLIPTLFEAVLLRHLRATNQGDVFFARLAWEEAEQLARMSNHYTQLLLTYALQDYKRALLAGGRGEIVGSWRRLAALARRGSAGRLCFVLALLRSPRISQGAFALRRAGRPVMLWAFRLPGHRKI